MPLAAASIEAVRLDDADPRSSTQSPSQSSPPAEGLRADAEGRFELVLSGPGAWDLVVDSPEHGRILYPLGDVAETRECVLVRIAATDEAKEAEPAHQGRVVDRRGRGLPGVKLRLDSAPGTHASDSDGCFRIPTGSSRSTPSPRSTDPTLIARLDGYAEVRVPVPAEPRAEEGSAPLRIVLDRLLRGQGAVLGADERPIAGAEVVLEGEGFSRRQVTTDARGHFELAELKAGDFDLAARAPGHAPLDVPGLEIREDDADADGVVDLGALVLARGQQLRGWVVDDGGQGIDGALVRWQSLGVRPASGEVHSDPAGSFQLDSLPPDGRLQLEASHPLHRPTTLGVDLEVTVSPIEMSLEPGAAIRLFREPGPPQADAETRSSEDGRFELAGLGPGRHLVRVESAAGRIAPLEVELLGGEVTTAAAVRGRVVSGLDGRAVGRVTVELLAHGRSPVRQAETLADGRFRLEVPEPGSYAVRAVPSGVLAGSAESRSPIFEVDGTDIDGLVLELQPGATVAGELIGAELGDLGRIRVVAFAAGRGERRGTVSYDGRYRIEGLGEGSWSLHVSGPGPSASAEVEITRPGEQVEHDFRLDGGYRLGGVVRIGGSPGAGLPMVIACAPGGSVHSLRTDAAGRFGIDSLWEESCQISIRHESGIDIRRSVELGTDQELEIEVGSMDIHGTVLASTAGDLPEGVRVELLDPRAGRSVRQVVGVDAAGRFTLPGVPEATWVVRARIPGTEIVAVREVGPGEGAEIRLVLPERSTPDEPTP